MARALMRAAGPCRLEPAAGPTGRCLRAAADFAEGDLLLAERPLLLVFFSKFAKKVSKVCQKVARQLGD